MLLDRIRGTEQRDVFSLMLDAQPLSPQSRYARIPVAMEAPTSDLRTGLGVNIQSVFHPTDFNATSRGAFAHALKIAVAGRTRFTVLHTDSRAPSELDWRTAPAVKKTLEAWGLFPEESPPEAVLSELGISVEKVALRGWSAVPTILDYLEMQSTVLIVLSTYGRDDLPRGLERAAAEPWARWSRAMALFVPRDVRGFVSSLDGSVSLNSILIPVDSDPGPQRAIEAAASIARSMAEAAVRVTLFHVGERDEMPVLELPSNVPASWTQAIGRGGVAEEILRTATERSADLIVMATRGHEGFLDALRGSTTEQILRRATCPVLAVPGALQGAGMKQSDDRDSSVRCDRSTFP